MKCDRCRRKFDAYWDRHRREDDLVSIKEIGLCMLCAIRVKVPQNWNPFQLGAEGRNTFKLKKQAEGKK